MVEVLSTDGVITAGDDELEESGVLVEEFTSTGLGAGEAAGVAGGIDPLAGGGVGDESTSVDVGDSNIFTSFTASAIQLNDTSCVAGLFKMMVKPVVVARATT